MDKIEWLLVPMVPTAAMLDAGAAVRKDHGLYGAYQHMLAAAPPAEQASGELSDRVRKALPGGAVDGNTYQEVEAALDRAEAPARDVSGRWLTLPERIAALSQQARMSEMPEATALGDPAGYLDHDFEASLERNGSTALWREHGMAKGSGVPVYLRAVTAILPQVANAHLLDGGDPNCAGGRGAEHCVVHAPRETLAALSTRETPADESPATAQLSGNDLAERCREVLQWQTTGLLVGDRLRTMARSLDDSDDMSLQRAEEATKREAMRAIAALSPQSTAPAHDGAGRGCEAEPSTLDAESASDAKVACHLCEGGVKQSRSGPVWCEACKRTGYRNAAPLSASLEPPFADGASPANDRSSVRTIKAGILGCGTSNLAYHALRDDGTAACSSYINVKFAGDAAAVDPSLRCRSRACQTRFAEADTAELENPRGGRSNG